jgi:predicted O-methyltransferase YrrM
MRPHWPIVATVAAAFVSPAPAGAEGADAVDRKVKAVLERMDGRWRDMNVPEQDGRILYDIVLVHGFKNALEIGTSTGHSALWIGWALSKTGGKLTTIEIDNERHAEAEAIFAEAGLSRVIDARLADAHELVVTLPGPFDFVFIDADKDWYTNYAKALLPKLAPGACLTAHNVHAPGSGGWGSRGGTGAYYTFMKSQRGFETSIHPDSVAGVAVSCRSPRP